mgnify:CR=1 FL=1
MEKFQIDPDEERKRHEEILKKVDPRIAEILRKHLPPLAPTTQEEQEKVEVAPEVPPRDIRDFKTHIELSQQSENDDKL